MMEERKPWFDTNREVLGEVVPLDTPLSITLTPSSVCNFKCNYCMQSAKREDIRGRGFKIEMMPWQTFLACVEQIGKFPRKLKKLDFYGMGEPLCNPRLPEMIAAAKAADICDTSSIMTNGFLLTHQVSDKLILSGVNEIKISLQGLSSEKYLEISRTEVDFDLLVNEVSYLNSIKGNCRLYVKIVDMALTPEDKATDKIKQVFGHICDRYSVESVLPLFSDVNYSGMMEKNDVDVVRTRYGQVQRVQRQICHFQFYRLIVLTDGRVTACCDPLNAIYWGNIRDCSLVDMWNSPARYKFLRLQLEKKGLRHALCQNCYMPNDVYSDVDDLEPYADKALQRLKVSSSQEGSK
jgi:sulfatase maturation enzyme AslB (radical SAM superfamily)